MPIQAISITEPDARRRNHAIRQLMEGRSNAHGSFTLDTAPATSTVVPAPTCGAGSHVSITPTNAAAAALSNVYVTAENGQFTVSHDATASSCTFSYGFIG